MILGADPRWSMLKHVASEPLAQFGLYWSRRRVGGHDPRRGSDDVWSPSDRPACHQSGWVLARGLCLGPSSSEWGRSLGAPIVITGFLGGLTTMSAFATGAIGMGNERSLGENLGSAVLAVTLCVLAAALGSRLGR